MTQRSVKWQTPSSQLALLRRDISICEALFLVLARAPRNLLILMCVCRLVQECIVPAGNRDPVTHVLQPDPA